MKTANVIKKMVAVGTGLAMVGATILGASASLGDYPSPFIKNGVPASNLALVVGENAAAMDVIGVNDLLQGLQKDATVTVSGSSSTSVTKGGGKVAVLGGDNIEIGSSGDFLELGERLGAVRDTFGSGDSNGGLKSDTTSNARGVTKYNQFLKFANDVGVNEGIPQFARNTNRGDQVGVYLKWDSQQPLFTYQIVFEQGLKSKVYTGLKLRDMQSQTLSLLGNTMSIVNADVGGALATPSLSIDLMSGAARITMSEGDTKEVTLDDKKMSLSVNAISETASSVILNINGYQTRELFKGDTDRLPDGTQIGVSDIVASAKSTQKSIVVVYVGANKLTLKDTNLGNSSLGGKLEVDNSNQPDANVAISASVTDNGDAALGTNDDVQINDISVTTKANSKVGSDIYVTPKNAALKDYPTGDGSLRSNLRRQESMIVPGWDLYFDGLTDPGNTWVKLLPSGNNKYRLQFTNQEGTTYDMPYLSADGESDRVDAYGGGTVNGFMAGDKNYRLHWREPNVIAAGITAGTANFSNNNSYVGASANVPAANDFVIALNEYFVVSDCTTSKTSCNSHVLRYDNFDSTNHVLSFSDLAGGSLDITYTLVNDSSIGGDNSSDADFGYSDNLIVGGKAYRVWTSDSGDGVNPSGRGRIVVDLNGNGGLSSDSQAIIGIQGLGLLTLGAYCDAKATGVVGQTADDLSAYRFDVNGDGNVSDNNGTNQSKQADCGVTGAAVWPLLNGTASDEYDATKFPTVAAGSTASEAANNFLGLGTLSQQFDEGFPQGSPTTGVPLVTYVQIVGRSSNQLGISGSVTRSLPVALMGSVAFAPAAASGAGMYPLGMPNNGTPSNATIQGPESPSSDSNLAISWTTYGAEHSIRTSSNSNNPETYTVAYPLAERRAQVFITFGQSSVSSGASGGAGGSQQVNALPIGVSKLDSEVLSTVTQWNAIVVGGPCANKVAAKLMNDPQPCDKDFPENKALVKLFDHGNGNMALLVAGQSALNTRQAARAVATGQIRSAGAKNEAFVTGTSLTEVTVSTA